MSTEPNTPTSRKGIDRDLAAFEDLPEKTKKLMKLMERDEKASGPEQVGTTREIQHEARKEKQ